MQPVVGADAEALQRFGAGQPFSLPFERILDRAAAVTLGEAEFLHQIGQHEAKRHIVGHVNLLDGISGGQLDK